MLLCAVKRRVDRITKMKLFFVCGSQLQRIGKSGVCSWWGGPAGQPLQVGEQQTEPEEVGKHYGWLLPGKGHIYFKSLVFLT